MRYASCELDLEAQLQDIGKVTEANGFEEVTCERVVESLKRH